MIKHEIYLKKNKLSELLEITNTSCFIIQGIITDKSCIKDDLKILRLIFDIEYGDSIFRDIVAFKSSSNSNIVINQKSGRFVIMPKEYGIILNYNSKLVHNCCLGYSDYYKSIIQIEGSNTYKPAIQYILSKSLIKIYRKVNKSGNLDNTFKVISIIAVILLFIFVLQLFVIISIIF